MLYRFLSLDCSLFSWHISAVYSDNVLPFIQLINNFCNELIVIQLFPAFHYTNNTCLDFMLSVFIYLSLCLVSFWFSFPLTGTGLLNFDSMKIWGECLIDLKNKYNQSKSGLKALLILKSYIKLTSIFSWCIIYLKYVFWLYFFWFWSLHEDSLSLLAFKEQMLIYFCRTTYIFHGYSLI